MAEAERVKGVLEQTKECRRNERMPQEQKGQRRRIINGIWEHRIKQHKNINYKFLETAMFLETVEHTRYRNSH